METKDSEIQKLAKIIRKAQIIGAILGVILVMILALQGMNPWLAFFIVFIPILTIIALLGHKLDKKLGIPSIQLKKPGLLSKKEVAILLALVIIGFGILFFSRTLFYIFVLFVILPYGYKLQQKWASRLKETVKPEKREEFDKAMEEMGIKKNNNTRP